MDPTRLRDILAVLKDMGVRRASIPVIDDGCMTVRQSPLEVEFESAGRPSPPTFVNPKTGEPVDLSEGAGELASETVDEAIARKNFAPEPKK